MGELRAEVTGREGSGSLGCVTVMELRVDRILQTVLRDAMGTKPRVERKPSLIKFSPSGARFSSASPPP